MTRLDGLQTSFRNSKPRTLPSSSYQWCMRIPLICGKESWVRSRPGRIAGAFLLDFQKFFDRVYDHILSSRMQGPGLAGWSDSALSVAR